MLPMTISDQVVWNIYFGHVAKKTLGCVSQNVRGHVAMLKHSPSPVILTLKLTRSTYQEFYHYF